MENLINKSLEEKRKFVSQFNLTDDTLCSVVLEDKKASEYVLSVLLGKQIKVVENKTQYSLKSITEHSAILDVLAKDEDVKHKIHYEIGHYIKGIGTDYDNGLYIHYFNTSAAGKSRSKLAALMRYFENSDPKNNSFGALSRRVSYFKYERGVDSMCKIIEDYAIKKQIETVKKLLEMGLSLDKALIATSLDRETYEKYCQDQ